jgi:ATP-dependent Lon protease
MIPEQNVKDLVDIPDNIKNKLDIHPVKWIDQVLEIALERMPEPVEAAGHGSDSTGSENPEKPSSVVTH